MTTPKTERMKVPVAIAAVVLALVITGFAWWLWYQGKIQECKDLASQRADDRAMWEYLIETSPVRDPNSPETKAFIIHMDKRLPRQTCHGTSLVTLPQEDK